MNILMLNIYNAIVTKKEIAATTESGFRAGPL